MKTLEKISSKLKERNQTIIKERGRNGDTEFSFTTRVTLLLIADIIDEVIEEEKEHLKEKLKGDF